MHWKDAKRGFGARLLLVVASVLLAALLCEAALRLLFPKYSVAAAGWMPSDNMRIFAPASNTRDEARHPDTGRRHPFHHNNLGLRQHRNFSDADIFSATTVGVFGDSFVHMPWLDAPYVFTEPLDYLLNLDGNFSVLNFGVSAYGPAQSYFAYQSFHAREAWTTCCSSTTGATTCANSSTTDCSISRTANCGSARCADRLGGFRSPRGCI